VEVLFDLCLILLSLQLSHLLSVFVLLTCELILVLFVFLSRLIDFQCKILFLLLQHVVAVRLSDPGFDVFREL